MALVGDDALVVELQRRLRLPRSSVPKPELITVALRLAREPDLDPSVGGFWQAYGLMSSGSRNSVKQYAKRMVVEGHLASAQQALTQPAAEQPWEALFGLSDKLLLEQRWIDEHVPNIVLMTVEPYIRSACGAFATRSILAQNTASSKTVRAKVKYDLPPVEGESGEDQRLRRRMMHRGREESALRALDDDAAAAFLAKRALQRHGLRERDAQICDVLYKLISAVERDSEREATAWRCPDGCSPGSADCARLAFRKQCVPTRRTNTAWVKAHTYTGWSGHEFAWEKQCEMRRLEPDYHEAFHVTEEMREDFLAMWDGIVEPMQFWEPWLSKRTSEWLGISLPTTAPFADEYGWDKRPVGPTACARRGCSGCCYCSGKPPPPVRVLVTEQHPANKNTYGYGTKFWLTIDELRSQVQRLAEPNSSRRCVEALPVYLLNRLDDDVVDEFPHDGRVIRVQRAVRDHVSPEELALWAEILAPKSIMLQILSGRVPWAADDASCQSHLASQEAAHAERSAPWKAARVWTLQSAFEAKFGCGLRLRQCDYAMAVPALRDGDIVYAAPQVKGGQFSQPGVAVVTRICRVVGAHQGCRTGDVDLVAWDLDKGVLTSVKREVPEDFVSLLPPCCGAGASCPHLQETMQWPNGDPMSRDDLEKLAQIPFQYSARFSSNAIPSRKRTISEDDHTAMKRMRATYVPSFFKNEIRRSMIKAHGAARMEIVYAGFRTGLADMLRQKGEASGEISESDDEVSICMIPSDGPDDL